jgi:hypothetical protein
MARNRMVYSANPHVVVRLNGRLGFEQQYVTDEFNPLWKFGEVRGGTNPILADGLYWTFFHSSLPWINGKRRYYMGAYAFEAKAPFRIARMTTMPILTGTNQQDWWPGLPAVVFPCGAFFDNVRSQFVVSYGINDVDCGYIKIPLSDMLEITKKIRPNRDIVKKSEPDRVIEVLDPIPKFHKQKKPKHNKQNELAKRLEQNPEERLDEPAGGESVVMDDKR